MKGSKATLLQRVCAWAVLLLLAAGAVYGAGRLIWWAALQLPANTARAALLVALMLLPLAAWASWCCARMEATGRLRGIDQSVDKIMGNLTKAAMLKVGTAQAMRNATAPQASVVMEMPRAELPPVHFPELVDGVIDL